MKNKINKKYIFKCCLLLFLFTTYAKANEDKQLVEQLKDLSLIDLLQVDITTASKAEEKITDTPASVVIVTRDEIAQHGYRTLEEILINTPGLYGIDSYYQEGFAFGVRGFWSSWTNKQLIILVDGIAQINPIRNNYILPEIAVPVEAIERIEVIRGPMSLIYGDGAFYGVINIITDPKKQENYIKQGNLLSAGIGSNETTKLFGRLSHYNKKGDIGYTLNASFYDTDGINADYDKMVPLGYMSDLGLTSTSTEGMLESRKSFINLNAQIKDFSIYLSWVETEIDGLVLFPGDKDGNYYPRKIKTLGLDYETDFSESLSFQAQLHYRDREQQYDHSPSAFLHQGVVAYENDTSSIYSIELKTIYFPIPSTRLIAGVNYRTIPDISIYQNIPMVKLDQYYYELKDKITTTSLYAQVNHDVSDQLKVIGGLRLEKLQDYEIHRYSLSEAEPFDITRRYDEGKTHVIPRLAVIYQPFNQHNFKLLYGEAVSWPSFDQNQPQVLRPQLKNLKAEKIKTYELVYNFLYSDKFNVHFNLFHNNLDNLIVRTMSLDPTSNQFIEIQNNAGELSTTGLETHLHFRPTTRWNVDLNMSYQQTKNTVDNTDVAYSPNLLGYIKTTYKMNTNMALALDGYYIGSMKPTINLDSGEPIGEETEGYFNLGANFRVENLFMQNSFLNLRVTNLLDEEIRYPTLNNNDWAVKGTIGEERSFLFSVGLWF